MTARIAVDTSAIVAILNREPEFTRFLGVLDNAEAMIGAPTLLEVSIWSLRQLATAEPLWLTHWLRKAGTLIVAFDADLERLAASAYDRYGKGRHPAALNFGDAMTYAVAIHYDAPLLFKGRDFGKTDVRVHHVSAVGA